MLLIYYANRAEKSILDPIIKELKNQNIEFLYEDLSTHVKNIEDDKNLSKVYDFVYNQIIDLKNKIKGSIVIGDRREIMFATMALFVKDIPVYQLAAGDLSEKISLVDDYFRHLITIISKKQVCFTRQSLKNSNKLRGLLNLETKSQFLPNPTLSDINLNDLKKKYSEPYDLILMHPQSLSVDNTISDSKITKLYFNKNKKTLTNVEICLFVALIISLFPLLPTNNFFNNWINVIYYISIGFFLYFRHSKNLENLDK